MRQSHLVAALLTVSLAPLPLLAQAEARVRDPAVTGSIAPRETTGVGQTKPPGAALGPDAGLTPELRERDRAIQRHIDTGICTGCTE
ncbi:hypothetical protein [Methylobacterium sp. SyP6R]|uniref:hypothetical protein n=1 Tax=Methylobacterium sp. SyP6R TaxID=2718876 RepID=UPI001F2998C6|nr:hypothetical protein [Methylobacterium sp. SyP6R]MCF4127429.1 hypothetical protein [Methylobacterium sp. SyP6R]